MRKSSHSSHGKFLSGEGRVKSKRLTRIHLLSILQQVEWFFYTFLGGIGVAFHGLSKFLLLCFQCRVNTAVEVNSTLFTLGAISVFLIFVRFPICM